MSHSPEPLSFEGVPLMWDDEVEAKYGKQYLAFDVETGRPMVIRCKPCTKDKPLHWRAVALIGGEHPDSIRKPAAMMPGKDTMVCPWCKTSWVVDSLETNSPGG